MKAIHHLTEILALAGYGFAAAGSIAAAAGHAISQKGKSISAKELTVAVGDSVVFMNDDGVKRNILIRGIEFNSGIQAPGTEATALFEATGRFKVRCGIHPRMKMTVVVH